MWYWDEDPLTTKDTKITKVGRMMSERPFHRFSFVYLGVLRGEKKL